MTKQNIGYLLPPGDAYEEELACAIVFYPDRKEYRQALLGSILHLSTWRAWEKEEEHKGIDAALSWKLATEYTLECMNMGCFEELQANVAAILALLQSNVPCCGDNITYGEQTTYNTIIIPNLGDAPTHYGETEVSDWEEWNEYLCHNANLWVDELIEQAGNIAVYLEYGGMTMGGLAVAIAAIALFVVGGFISVPVLMLGVAGLSVGIAGSVFEDAADDLEAARTSIVCAILGDRGVAMAVESALSSGVAWNLFYSLIDYDSAIAVLYEGGDGDAVFLEAVADGTCSCVCIHANKAEPENTVGGVSSAGAWMIMPRRAGYGFSNVAYGSVVFNNVEPIVDYCGPMKTIDSIDVTDGLKFNRIQTKDQDDNTIDDWYQPLRSCDYDASLLVGKTFARVYFERFQPSDGGCGSSFVTISMTYHDA